MECKADDCQQQVRVLPGRGRPPVYCSQECQQRQRRRDQRDEEARERDRVRGRERYARGYRKPSQSRPCSRCGTLLNWRPERGSVEQPLCRPCRRVLHTRVCQQCGGEFWRPQQLRENTPFKYCSIKCKTAAAKKYDDPRASSKASSRARRLRHAETWDGVTDQQIWERDGWECQIPGCDLGPVLQFVVVWPHQLSATVDHIVPLSRGGADTVGNKRAAHLICNVQRGNRMTLEEEGLVMPELAPLGLIPVSRKPKSPKSWPCLISCQLPDCGMMFFSTNPAKRYCSGICAEEANRRRTRLRYAPKVGRVGSPPLPWR